MMRILARIAIGLACWTIGKIRGGYHGAPYAWLSHYLIGNGQSMRIRDPRLLEEFRTWILSTYRDEYGGFPRVGETVPIESYFRSRLIAWYLVGGMTMRVESELDEGLLVHGVDHYDWFQDRGSWDTILPITVPEVFGKLAKKMLNIFCPAMTEALWFSDPTLDSGRIHIVVKDRLLVALGGRPFDTVVEFLLERPAAEDTAIINDSEEED